MPVVTEDRVQLSFQTFTSEALSCLLSKNVLGFLGTSRQYSSSSSQSPAPTAWHLLALLHLRNEDYANQGSSRGSLLSRATKNPLPDCRPEPWMSTEFVILSCCCKPGFSFCPVQVVMFCSSFSLCSCLMMNPQLTEALSVVHLRPHL